MDRESNRHISSLSYNDKELLKSRVIETCKFLDADFSADIERIRSNVNYIFNTNYSIDDVSYIIGEIYEIEFFYNQLIE